MTEAEWRTTDDWRAMLAWLLGQPVSARKWILYACGGLRQIWDCWLQSDRSRNAVEVAERAADGRATEEEIQHAAYLAQNQTLGYDFIGEFVLVKFPGLRFSPDFCRLTDWGNIREEEVGSEDDVVQRQLR